MFKKIGTLQGLISGVAVTIVLLLIRLNNLQQHKFANFAVLLVFVMGIIISTNMQDKASSYQSNFLSIFGAGFRAIATSILIIAVGMWLQYALMPDLKLDELKEIEVRMKTDKLKPQEIQDQINNSKKYFLTMKTSQYTLPFFVFGLIMNAIFSGVIYAKNKNKKQTL
jgi:hypothetical protein